MSTEKSPAFQFYPKDYLTDVKVVAMTPEIRGLYIQLLCHDWLENGLCRTDLKRLSGYEMYRADHSIRDDWDAIEQVLNTCFEQHPNNAQKVTNPRLQKERERQQDNREKKRLAGLKSGKVRKNKQLGVGTSVQLCSNKTRTKTNSSSSSSSSSSIDRSINRSIEHAPLVQFGKHIRMTEAEMQTLIKLYTKPLVDQEIPEADLFVEKGNSRNCPKYRKPTHNHYLFMRTTWLKDKRLRGTNGFPNKADVKTQTTPKIVKYESYEL